MKAASTFTRILTCVLAVAATAMFLFKFVTIGVAGTNVSLTGFEICFGSTQEIAGATYHTYKSAYYFLAAVFSVLSIVFAGFSFKYKGTRYASVVASLAAGINLAVILFQSSMPKYLDVRPLDTLGKLTITKEAFFFAAFGLAVAAFVCSVAALLIADYAEAKASNGAKLTIPQRIKRFFKDYKSELKKIVWPSRSVVMKNTIVVVVMCLIVGAYIWVLDYGLVRLLGLILGVDLT